MLELHLHKLFDNIENLNLHELLFNFFGTVKIQLKGFLFLLPYFLILLVILKLLIIGGGRERRGGAS